MNLVSQGQKFLQVLLTTEPKTEIKNNLFRMLAKNYTYILLSFGRIETSVPLPPCAIGKTLKSNRG